MQMQVFLIPQAYQECFGSDGKVDFVALSQKILEVAADPKFDHEPITEQLLHNIRSEVVHEVNLVLPTNVSAHVDDIVVKVDKDMHEQPTGSITVGFSLGLQSVLSSLCYFRTRNIAAKGVGVE